MIDKKQCVESETVMKISGNVFGSKSEKLNYDRIIKQWGDRYNIYHNFPFMMIFDISPSEVSNTVFQYLLKTSVDYVVCDLNDRPLMGIEFDGFQQGSNIGTEYVPKKGFDESRKWRIETKLQIAQECNFPLVVTSDREFELLSDTGLTIVDGIIGALTSRIYFKREFQQSNFEEYVFKRFSLNPEEFARLDKREQSEIFESFGISIEVDSDMQNPVVNRRWQIHGMLRQHFGLSVGKFPLLWSMGGVNVSDPKKFRGGKFTWKHPEYGEIETIVILPLFEITDQKLYVGSIAINIAALIGITKMAKRMGVTI
ncbi:MAG: hypothetical protein AAFR81_29255 [Chloroflexota bacterium]